MDLGVKTIGSHAHASMLKRLNIIPGSHGVKGRRKISDFGTQLREKQKVKRMYGLLERQFRRTFEHAKKWKGKKEFKDVGAVVYFLKAIPWIVPGFSVRTHVRYLQKLQNKADKGERLIFTEVRYLVLSKKV